MKRQLAAIALAAAALGSASPASADPAPYRITMLLYRGCEEACKGFQGYFRQHGIAAEFTLRDAAQDKHRIASDLELASHE